MKSKGLLQAIVVRPVNSHFEVVAGHRRYVSAIEIGWSDIAANVIQADDKEAFELALLENIQRKSMDPQEEGEAFYQYTMENGWGSATELAKKLGITPSQVSRRISFARNSSEDIFDSVKSGQLTLSHAEELNRLDTAKAEEMMDKIFEHGLDVNKTRVAINGVKAGLSVDTSVQHALEWPDMPYSTGKAKVDPVKVIRQHVELSLDSALKNVSINLEELADGPEKEEWTKLVRYPLHELLNSAIRLRKKYDRAAAH